jgi:hypothetical protein
MIARYLTLPLLVVLYGACTAPVGSSINVPSNAASTCETHCRDIGLELSAVAIMANNVGCICERPKAPAATGQRGESVTAGMATIMLQQAEADRQARANASQQKK